MESDIKKIEKIEPEDYILLFSIGSNDSRYIDRKDNVFVSLEEFEENLWKIIKIAKGYSKEIIFTGLLKVNDELTRPWNKNEFWENKDIKEYDSVIERICLKEKIGFISFFSLIDEGDLSDGLHPNVLGHEKIFDCVREYLLKRV